MDFKNYLEKLRDLPDKQKKIVLWTIVAILAATMGYFWIRGTMDSLSKISNEAGQIKLPGIQTPAANIPATPAPTDQTADWNTYANNNFGFEMKIPNNFNVDDTSNYPANDQTSFTDFLTFRFPQTEQKLNESLKECDKADNIGACVQKTEDNNFDIYFYLQQKNPNDGYYLTKGSIIINGITWNLLYREDFGDGEPAYAYYTFYNSEYYIFDVYGKNKQLLEQVLSTFKFINYFRFHKIF